MLYFHNDYNVMCHPAVMEKMAALRDAQMQGYGEDVCCEAAANKIRALCERDDLAVHFLVGGTQTNLTVIAAALRPYQAVIGADSAHINVHETGAIEAAGHKVIAFAGEDGKVDPRKVDAFVIDHYSGADSEHMAQPGMVYISNSTEVGTIYTKKELEELSAVCRKHGMYLYMDGARLGYALAAEDNDVTMADLARLCDVFYIGGTKVGAMFGEAVVIANPQLARDFRYMMKQRGAMLAKGWLLGIQFDALMEDGLYEKISAHAVAMAERIRQTLKKLGYPLLVGGTTNQVFPILPDAFLAELEQDFTFTEMHRVDEGHRAVRFCTSWATEPEHVDALCEALRRICKKLRNS